MNNEGSISSSSERDVLHVLLFSITSKINSCVLFVSIMRTCIFSYINITQQYGPAYVFPLHERMYGWYSE